MEKNIFIIAGEPSGDMRGAELLAEFKKLVPNIPFWGIGGDLMKKQGVRLSYHIRDFSMIGIWEVLKKLVRIRKQYLNILRQIKQKKPSLAILIDYPGFNLKIAKALHLQGIPVIYYIIPQVWAWGEGRTKLLKKYTKKALVLFDFEKTFLEKYNVNCEFTGHPLVDKVPALVELPKDKQTFTVALLPGSRKNEILRLFPVMLDSALLLAQKRKDLDFILAENSNIDKNLYDKIIAQYPSLPLNRRKDNTFAVLNQCDFAMVTSGTATLETALMEKPMVLMYKTSFLTAYLSRLFIKVKFLGLVNLIAGKEIAPEFLQENAVPEKISSKILGMINNKSELSCIRKELIKVKLALGEKGAAKRAAEIIAQEL
ncbi:MAG: lipid-A-disaccharide synthase [Candidatus Omnitrophota bacterium]